MLQLKGNFVLLATFVLTLFFLKIECYLQIEKGYGVCTAAGDPHFELYDGGMIHYQGICRYLMSGTCKDDMKYPFQVYTEHEVRHIPDASHVKAVEIHFMKWIIRFEKNGVICITDPNGNVFTLASGTFASIPSATVSLIPPNHMVFETNFGLRVEYESNSLVTITAPLIYFELLCGICGNFNGINDDRVTKYGIDVSGYPTQTGDNMIGDSWLSAPGKKSKLPKECYEKELTTEVKTVDLDLGWKRCKPYFSILMEYIVKCQQWLNEELIKSWLEGCAYDVALLDGAPYAHCEVIEAIIRLIERICGITITGWREKFDCPCEDGSYRDPCLPCEQCKGK